MGFYDLLVGSLMEPEDDFCQRLRKSVVAFLFCPASFIACGYTLVLAMGLESAGTAKVVMWFADLIITLSFWGLYVWLRKKRHLGDGAATFIPWVTMLSTSTFFLYDPEVNYKSLAILSGLMGILLQVRALPLLLVDCFLFATLQDWNSAHLDQKENILALPGYITGNDPLNRFMSGLLSSVLLCAVIYNFYRQVQETERRGQAQATANVMTLEILKCQRKYDTAKITQVIDDYHAAGVVDAELVGLFRSMNDNLESYRPFLPNYLFQESEVEAMGDDEDEGEVASIAQDTNSDINGGRRGRRAGSIASESYSVDDRSSKAATIDQLSLHTNTAILNKRGQLFEGRITFALVDINTTRLTGDDVSDTTASILKAVAHTIYSLAKETRASVHSMLGDTVQLTWNATQNVALPETKGAVFLAMLKKLLSDKTSSDATSRCSKSPAPAPSSSSTPATLLSVPPLLVNAAVCSGTATVHNITTQHQQALMIEAHWLPALEGCFHLAKQVIGGCVLMDERTTKGSALEIESCPVEQLTYSVGESPSSADPSTFLGLYKNDVFNMPQTMVTAAASPSISATTLVYELLDQQVRADDEWMYQLQKSNTATSAGATEMEMAGQKRNTLHRSLLSAVAENRFEEAGSAMATLNSMDHNQDGPMSVANPGFLSALAARCRRDGEYGK